MTRGLYHRTAFGNWVALWQNSRLHGRHFDIVMMRVDGRYCETKVQPVPAFSTINLSFHADPQDQLETVTISITFPGLYESIPLSPGMSWKHMKYSPVSPALTDSLLCSKTTLHKLVALDSKNL